MISAVLVGGTFMVNTMLGLQEARARSPDNPTAMLGLMTAAFATGQLAGPLVSGVLDQLSIGHIAAMDCGLAAGRDRPGNERRRALVVLDTFTE